MIKAALENMISIDIEARRLDLNVNESELDARLKVWKRPPARITKGYLARYSGAASSAAEGAKIRS